jgi:hypothetical protein
VAPSTTIIHWSLLRSSQRVKKLASKLHVFKYKKNYAGSENHYPHELRKRSHFGTEYRKAPQPQKGKEEIMGIRRVAGLA